MSTRSADQFSSDLLKDLNLGDDNSKSISKDKDNEVEKQSLLGSAEIRCLELGLDEVSRGEVIQTIQKLINLNVKLGDKIVSSIITEQVRTMEGVKEGVTISGTALQMSNKLDEIVIPYNLESCSDDALLVPALNYCFKYNISVRPGPGTYNGNTDNSFKTFISGYFSELCSDEPIVNIKIQKDKLFQNGRACARFEILKGIVPSEHQAYIKNIPKELLNESKNKPGRLSSMVNSYISEKERTNVYEVLRCLARHASHRNGLEKLSLKDFYLTADEIIARHKRTRKTQKKIGRKVETRLNNITCPKPYTLSVVAPFEIAAMKEVFDFPYEELENLKNLYRNIDPKELLKFDMKSFEKDIQHQINEQWKNKNNVLRALRSREVRLRPDSTIEEIIKSTKEMMIKVDHLSIYKNMLKDEGRIPWMPSGTVRSKDGTQTPFREFAKQNKEKFSDLLLLISIEEEFQSSIKMPESISSESADPNRFSALRDDE
jgi:hypothetical protein